MTKNIIVLINFLVSSSFPKLRGKTLMIRVATVRFRPHFCFSWSCRMSWFCCLPGCRALEQQILQVCREQWKPDPGGKIRRHQGLLPERLPTSHRFHPQQLRGHHEDEWWVWNIKADYGIHGMGITAPHSIFLLWGFLLEHFFAIWSTRFCI